jgi:hypothetical protein
VYHKKISAHAIVEWVFCVPLLGALTFVVCGFVYLVYEQSRLEELSIQAAEMAANSDADTDIMLREQVMIFLSRYIPRTEFRIDRHFPSWTSIHRNCWS